MKLKILIKTGCDEREKLNELEIEVKGFEFKFYF